MTDTTTFLVETGNWRASIILQVKPSAVTNYDYIEAATRAIESVFDERKDIGDSFDMIHLYNKDRKDYFDAEYTGNLSDVPDPLFGMLTACFLEKDKNSEENWWYFLSSKIFANAGQHKNSALAESVEKNYAEEVAEFKSQENELIELDKKGQLGKKLNNSKGSHKASKKKKLPPKKDIPPPQDESGNKL